MIGTSYLSRPRRCLARITGVGPGGSVAAEGPTWTADFAGDGGAGAGRGGGGGADGSAGGGEGVGVCGLLAAQIAHSGGEWYMDGTAEWEMGVYRRRGCGWNKCEGIIVEMMLGSMRVAQACEAQVLGDPAGSIWSGWRMFDNDGPV